MTDPIKRGGGAGPVDPSESAGGAAGAGPTGQTGRTEEFREALSVGAAESVSPPLSPPQGADASTRVGELNQLSESLRAGTVSPEQAVEALVERQLQSPSARLLAPAQRAELESLLRSRLADDPTLLALGRDLSRGR